MAAHFGIAQFVSGYERIYREVLERARGTITLRRIVPDTTTDTAERASA